MSLKFYLNKVIKIDNIEGYTLKSLNLLKDSYSDYLKKSNGIDPDYPGMVYPEYAENGVKISGQNAYSIFGDEENIPDDYKGIHDDRLKNE